ncbi:unnamed protein product [Nyctereutes procyonoides]|uniref:(raccoon dog) hypothetical protein n=1 Tax=Nyctereutes procyonoides TaxID=34880 RepID=A0A811YNS0_NYCPR|nr:unnamed protein product [Nyctereutes procyonoides]
MIDKKPEIQLQAFVNSPRLWDEMLQKKNGVTVINFYQAWCGPCKAMQTLFRKLKNELNEDELLHFVITEADNIVTLQPFRDKCEPVFLFSVNAKIIAKINGTNAPLYHEIVFVDSDADDAGEIKERMIKAGFVVEIEDKILTEQQVRDFCHIVVISQGGEEQPAREDPEPNPEMEAKKIYEDNQRWSGLQQHISQFCDIEENLIDVNHFIDMSFPDFKNMKKLKLEKTLDILKIIEDEGFKILMQRQIILSEEEVQTSCKEYENDDYFESLIEKMAKDIFKLIREAVFEITQQTNLFKNKGKDFHEDVLQMFSEGPSLVMVLTKSTLNNTVHGTSNTYKAMESINRIFEEFILENPEGN